MASTLVATGLAKSFRKREVVRGVSFTVAPGEIVGLLGPNGAGKSTSFKMVAGLLPPDAGTVVLGDRDMGSLPLYRRAQMGLGYLPQDATIFRGMTVLQNFMAAYEAVGVKGSEGLQKAKELAAHYKLDHVEDSLGSTLSGGERRRTEMARTLIPDPDIVLLDEPFAGVDPIAVGEIKGFVERMRAVDIGVLLTDHSVRETLGICDRAYLIFEGRILLSGTPQELVADPEARRVYLGEDFSL